MSYRTYVNGIQIFGNNECYPEWIDFLRTQGVYVDDNCCYKGSIKDVMGAIAALEKIVVRLEDERRDKIRSLGVKDTALNNKRRLTSLFNFTREYDDFLEEDEANSDTNIGSSITDKVLDIREYSLVFLPSQFIDACADAIEKDEPFSFPRHFNCYKLKEGCEITVKAS